MVHQVAILNTIFGHDRAFCVRSIAHPENVLRRHVVFGHAPPNLFALVDGLLVVPSNQEYFPPVALIDRQHRELLAIHIIIGRERTDLNVNEIARMQSRQIFAEKFRAIAEFRVLHIRDFLDVVTDVLRGHVVQFVRRQVEVAAEITVHIHLQTTAHRHVSQVVFATRNRNLGVFNLNHRVVFAIPFPAKFAVPARQLQKFVHTMRLFGSAKQKLVIESENIVPNNDVGILFSHQLGPFEQNVFLRFQLVAIDDLHRFNGRAFHRLTPAQDDAMIQVRLGSPIVHKG